MSNQNNILRFRNLLNRRDWFLFRAYSASAQDRASYADRELAPYVRRKRKKEFCKYEGDLYDRLETQKSWKWLYITRAQYNHLDPFDRKVMEIRGLRTMELARNYVLKIVSGKVWVSLRRLEELDCGIEAMNDFRYSGETFPTLARQLYEEGIFEGKFRNGTLIAVRRDGSQAGPTTADPIQRPARK